ncbi:MAG TPA: GntR family transcriptional regulator, partial [Bryobacteraceae bacterium]|nr:GntR family transcriptional regulator [Bryobacteraceae bacterium]
MPLYHQLHRHFTGLIRSGALKQGDRLPPTRELAGLLGLNRTTVSAAYALLESDGLIAGQVGRGSYVTGAAAQHSESLDWDAILDARHASSSQPVVAGAISFA